MAGAEGAAIPVAPGPVWLCPDPLPLQFEVPAPVWIATLLVCRRHTCTNTHHTNKQTSRFPLRPLTVHVPLPCPASPSL